MADKFLASQVSTADPWPVRLVGVVCSAAFRRPLLATLLLWAILFLPFAGTRSLYYEEGRYTLAALDMLANGHWLRPEVLGLGFVEKPPALFWLIGAASALAGGPSEWAIRAPAALATLLGALLAAGAARRIAGPKAALVAAIAFMLSPFTFTKGVRAEPDLFVTVTSFAAFLLWLEVRRWSGRRSVAGWGAVLLLLSATAMFKGPQPLGYFGIGAGLVALTERRWRELPALMAVGVIAAGLPAAWAAVVYEPGDELTWRGQLRMAGWPELSAYVGGTFRFIGESAAELMPWLALAVPALLPAWRRRVGLEDRLPRAMAFYAFGCTALLAFWPGALARYATPASPAVAVLAGLAGAALWRTGPVRWRQALAALLLVAIGVRLVWVAAIPFETARNEASRRLASELTAPIGASRDPLLLLGPAIDYNAAFYMQQAGLAPRQIRTAKEIVAPAWLIGAGEPPPGGLKVEIAADRKGFVYRLYRVLWTE